MTPPCLYGLPNSSLKTDEHQNIWLLWIFQINKMNYFFSKRHKLTVVAIEAHVVNHRNPEVTPASMARILLSFTLCCLLKMNIWLFSLILSVPGLIFVTLFMNMSSRSMSKAFWKSSNTAFICPDLSQNGSRVIRVFNSLQSIKRKQSNTQ